MGKKRKRVCKAARRLLCCCIKKDKDEDEAPYGPSMSGGDPFLQDTARLSEGDSDFPEMVSSLNCEDLCRVSEMRVSENVQTYQPALVQAEETVPNPIVSDVELSAECMIVDESVGCRSHTLEFECTEHEPSDSIEDVFIDPTPSEVQLVEELRILNENIGRVSQNLEVDYGENEPSDSEEVIFIDPTASEVELIYVCENWEDHPSDSDTYTSDAEGYTVNDYSSSVLESTDECEIFDAPLPDYVVQPQNAEHYTFLNYTKSEEQLLSDCGIKDYNKGLMSENSRDDYPSVLPDHANCRGYHGTLPWLPQLTGDRTRAKTVPDLRILRDDFDPKVVLYGRPPIVVQRPWIFSDSRLIDDDRVSSTDPGSELYRRSEKTFFKRKLIARWFAWQNWRPLRWINI